MGSHRHECVETSQLHCLHALSVCRADYPACCLAPCDAIECRASSTASGHLLLSSHAVAHPPQPLLARPQVTATVCREGTLQEVAVRLGVESALGTTSVVHFCGAQFQVLPGRLDAPLSMTPMALTAG